MPTFLHVGCGPARKMHTTPGFNTDAWQELRFDIDPAAQPDIIGTMLDMSEVAPESMDAIFSSHNIEHLNPHEVPLALQEFACVLKPEGFLVLTCPDLQSVCALVAEGRLHETAYISPAGPIAPIDILYGHRAALARGNFYMAHRCGFTQASLDAALRDNGFASTLGLRRGFVPCLDLWVLASKSERSEAELRALALQHFPLASADDAPAVIS